MREKAEKAPLRLPSDFFNTPTSKGFRNTDIRGILNISPEESDPQARERQAAAIPRRFRLLRAHGIIQKIRATHRYQLTDFGRALNAAVLSAHRASVQKLTSAA